VSGFLDTSVVVRYLTGDPPTLADRAAAVIDRAEDLFLTAVVLAESAHVLLSVYGIAREVVVDHLVLLVRRKNVRCFALDKGVVIQALLLCRGSGRVSFADAMLWAAARSAGPAVVYTFDARFPDDGVELR